MKLMLGTVQFGQNYGVANTLGIIKEDSALKILSYASSVGIKWLDTAANYGTSEEIIGKISIREFDVVTKLPAIHNEIDDVNKWVTEHFKSSVKKLNISGEVGGILFHNPDDLFQKYGDELLMSVMNLKKQGLVRAIGVSIYNPNTLKNILNKFKPDIVQVPYNIFDQRIKTSGWLQKLIDNNIEIHARSVFLQGLLLMDPNNLPNYFINWKNLILKWYKYIATRNITPLEAALNFVYTEEGITKVVVGVDSLIQLKQIVNALNKCNFYNEFAQFASDDIRLIEPFRWES